VLFCINAADLSFNLDAFLEMLAIKEERSEVKEMKLCRPFFMKFSTFGLPFSNN
jgi:hypothetical protein